MEASDWEGLEAALTGLYCYLHAHDAVYDRVERRELAATGGYGCHAGGLFPVIMGEGFIGAGTRLADYGAGNGLQGLLYQALYPHRKTVQIELSAHMIEKGRRLQGFMGIPEGLVEWRLANILDVPPDDFDFIYLYRPVRPKDGGLEFYRRLAAGLAGAGHEVTVFSVADCLGPFLKAPFRTIYHDGHLACFSNR